MPRQLPGRAKSLWMIVIGTPGRTRTCGLLLRRQTLYPLSYGCAPNPAEEGLLSRECTSFTWWLSAGPNITRTPRPYGNRSPTIAKGRNFPDTEGAIAIGESNIRAVPVGL